MCCSYRARIILLLITVLLLWVGYKCIQATIVQYYIYLFDLHGHTKKSIVYISQSKSLYIISINYIIM